MESLSLTGNRRHSHGSVGFSFLALLHPCCTSRGAEFRGLSALCRSAPATRNDIDIWRSATPHEPVGARPRHRYWPAKAIRKMPDIPVRSCKCNVFNLGFSARHIEAVRPTLQSVLARLRSPSCSGLPKHWDAYGGTHRNDSLLFSIS